MGPRSSACRRRPRTWRSWYSRGGAWRLVAAAAGVLLVTSCTDSGGSAGTTPTVDSSATKLTAPVELEQSYHAVVHKVLPSVVQIRTASGLGSGVVYDNRGDIVTNAHVVGNATSFEVQGAQGGTPLKATLVGVFAPGDLAVVRVSSGEHLPPAQFADSSKAQVGDIVLAMGNPLGLSSSVTNGIISAVGRTVSEPSDQNSPGATLPDVIQTSAAINPGNSGGALVDVDGKVVGIPTLAATDPELGGGAAPGIGFAIPSNMATDVAGQLVSKGRVVNSHRAALGVEVTTAVGPDGNPKGVGVAAVLKGGPADHAGLRAGYVITAVDNTPTPTSEALSAVLAGLRPGQRVPVAVIHPDGTKATVQVVLGTLPAS